jgi:spore coat polysaccharide biosynthesis protein SpsF
MTGQLGILIFARNDSTRLPRKALRSVGGIPLLERVIRRAQLSALPVYLATTEKDSDDSLVALAESAGIKSFRGPAERVLDRAVFAAESFGLEAFFRVCGDRPLFPLDDLERATSVFRESATFRRRPRPDLVTNYAPPVTARGLTTELVRTDTLRSIMQRQVSADQQEHVTAFFYDRPSDFNIVELANPPSGFACPGFAVDTASDLEVLNRIFSVSDALDLTAAEADRIYSA